MSDKRPTREEALRAYEEAYTNHHRGETLMYDRLRGLDAVAELFGGFAEPIVEMPEVEPSSIHACGTDLTLQQEEVLCARSNAWPSIVQSIGFALLEAERTCRLSSQLPVIDTLRGLLVAVTAPEMGIGPDLKS
jgi:hypothetical protein